MIIVEGPDGSGKTTLAKRLCSEFDLDYRRPASLSSSLGPTNGTSVPDWWDKEIASGGQCGVYDRCFYISEFIYQPNTKDRKLLVGADRMVAGLERLWGASPMVIFCLPPFDAQVKSIQASGRERLKGLDELGEVKIAWMYHYVARQFQEVLFDWTTRYDWMIDGDNFNGEGQDMGERFKRLYDSVARYLHASSLGF